jgi:signal transduction histidine kinase
MNSDVAKIKKVLKALITNGLKYTQKGGVYVRITTVSHEYGVNLCIEVTDTGKGIERKNIKNVFRPGFTTKKRGWGLGLSLARRIIEEYHHGSIYVLRSEVGKGTTFRIEI